MFGDTWIAQVFEAFYVFRSELYVDDALTALTVLPFFCSQVLLVPQPIPGEQLELGCKEEIILIVMQFLWFHNAVPNALLYTDCGEKAVSCPLSSSFAGTVQDIRVSLSLSDSKQLLFQNSLF